MLTAGLGVARLADEALHIWRPAQSASSKEQDATDDESDPSINGPLGLPSHKAPRQHVDALKEPNRANDYEYDTDDV